MAFIQHLFNVFIVLYLHLHTTSGTCCSTSYESFIYNPSAKTPHHSLHARTAIASGVHLRILPLGDSITWGERSTDENGYRLHLSNLLTGTNPLTYIGSVQSGSMLNNSHEGHGGFQIIPVGLTAKPDYVLRPNVVLFMAGTNDIIFDAEAEKAPRRLGTVVMELANECPDAAVLVGTLLPLLNPDLAAKVVAFNEKVPGIVGELAEKGKKVALVDMSRVTTKYIHQDDKIHPTDEGYELIAAAWHDGIVEAGNRGWIKEPSSQDPPTKSGDGTDSVADIKPNTQSVETPLIDQTWTAAQMLVYLLLFVGLAFCARKAVVFFLRRYNS